MKWEVINGKMFSVDQIARETGVEANAMDVLALK